MSMVLLLLVLSLNYMVFCVVGMFIEVVSV